MTHTPGPWEICKDAVPEYHEQFTVYAEDSGERVATVFQAEDNAHLMAAAPELLEALKTIALLCAEKGEKMEGYISGVYDVRCHECSEYLSNIYHIAAIAIRKAEQNNKQ